MSTEKSPVADGDTLPAAPGAHGSGAPPPMIIGPYQLVRRLGEGGMGEVWEADQQAPVRRHVALKLIKLGMGSREIIARFESERQALAIMQHRSRGRGRAKRWRGRARLPTAIPRSGRWRARCGAP
jgi:serine/threonine protein kinase